MVHDSMEKIPQKRLSRTPDLWKKIPQFANKGELVVLTRFPRPCEQRTKISVNGAKASGVYFTISVLTQFKNLHDSSHWKKFFFNKPEGSLLAHA